jgi:hypothetical protein
MKSSQLGNLLGTVGVLYAIYNGIDKSQSFGKLAAYSIVFGLGGVLIGNAISK